MESIFVWGNPVSNISGLENLTKLKKIDICGGKISDITALAGLTGLKELYLRGNQISDISPLAGLTQLPRLELSYNNISDVSPLAGLTNLKWLHVGNNNISDFSPLDRLRENIKLIWYSNPGFPKGGPKILGPWLWAVVPGANLDRSTDLLSDASGGTVTERGIATHGAVAGEAVGTDAWAFHTLPPSWHTGEMLKHPSPEGIIYGVVSLYSPREQNTTLYVGSEREFKVWLNGTLTYSRLGSWWARDYDDFLSVTLKQGRNVLLIALRTAHLACFGFEPGTEYTLGSGIGCALSEMPVHTGDTFTFDVRADSVSNLAGWQFDLAFDPVVLEANGVREGDFLKSDGGATFFQSGRIDNSAGKITGLIAGRISEGGASGSGSLLQVEFTAKSEGETELALDNFEFGSLTGENIPASPLEVRLTVEDRLVTGDVNRDGRVSILDLILVAQQLGKRVAAGSPVDINADGIVNIFDLTLVAQGIVGAAAPAVATGRVDAATIEAWIAEARLADDGSIAFRQGIQNLENLLASLIIPQETALHANYPNPFNPETWIPYQLATPSEVTLTLYDLNGGVVRHLNVGHQAAGTYQSRNRALYWDGRNRDGEPVASGLYFYTLRAGEFTATRRMLIRK